ncbi:UDP-N-acetylmuramoylalanine--D-glutamate ligase [Sulfuritortus calidifontis]|uniref:UDP-N-acetylmuramoylalanine--D-glutamate ligase n=1 Tax=Sulfuritortus calidifontis TaxID=1914471 RepID=A0A4R3JTX1_9PROT|nr:UDP-N-acetylmuramoyl-L-alanine--D-glutamate ligase [Sulfuritortus calidifontis]TCS71037.1 UDP-N-acetylmuramoylalanine--D-glutamate ligase [Sulfuritortus calidifontis]
MHAKLNLEGRKALVVGLGDTGLSCVRWLLSQGAEVRATDSREAPPHAERLREAQPGVAVTLAGFRQVDFDWADLIVVSPGVAVATPEIQAAAKAGKDIVGDVELFARAVQGSRPEGTPRPPFILAERGLPQAGEGRGEGNRGPGPKVIAITGSNGKSTVTSLVGHLCQAAGLKTVVAGNIGLPVLDALTEQGDARPDVYVLELSSFQLETTSSLAPDAATVLNLSEDHMDRYAGMADYAAAKARIFAGAGAQVLNRDDALVLAMRLPGRTIYSFGLGEPVAAGEWGLIRQDGRYWLAEHGRSLMPVDELPIAGLHNAANALAALALCRAVGIDDAPLLAGLKTFKGLPHRVEAVATIKGVTFYDDSKGTNVGATVAALLGMTCPVVLIAGGDGKGQDFSPLKDAVKNARAVVQIGRDGPRIAAAIAGTVPVQRAESLEAAVRQGFTLARPGDAVLLSPACASFDMFRNYVHRAEVFIQAVQALKTEEEGVHVL